jgi:hypothetical protein
MSDPLLTVYLEPVEWAVEIQFQQPAQVHWQHFLGPRDVRSIASHDGLEEPQVRHGNLIFSKF